MLCKGLHCAGCGKGIPLSIILIVVSIAALNSRAFDDAVMRALAEIAALAAISWIATLAVYAIFCRRGPTVVNTKTDRIWYSEIKYMETGDPSWLVFSQPREIAVKETAPVIIRGEVERVENIRLCVAFLHGLSHERQNVQ
jgi:hypothetical protein